MRTELAKSRSCALKERRKLFRLFRRRKEMPSPLPIYAERFRDFDAIARRAILVHLELRAWHRLSDANAPHRQQN